MSGVNTDRIDGISTSVAVKAPVRVATTGNIILSGLQTVDGISLVDGDRVFVRAQTNPVDNGIYQVTTTAWRRDRDFDGARDCVKGTDIPVVEGTTYGGKSFLITTNNPIVIGTSPITSTVKTLSSDELVQAEAARDEAVAARDAAVAAAAGMKWRPSVKVATTANITLSGAQTIDGVSAVAGNRVLVKNQSTTSQNGVYVVASGAWTRATDADTWDELVSQVVAVEEGTTQADKIYICTSNAGGTLGSTAVTWFELVIAPTGVVPVLQGGTGLTALETTVASASTIDLGAQLAHVVNITGTTTITSFGTAAAGTRREIRPQGVFQITHNGTSLICPNGANITTAVGQVYWAHSLGSGNWRIDAPSPVAGIRLQSSVATTSGTTVDLSTSIPAGVNEITIMLDGVSLSGTDNLLVQIGDSGGFEVTGYLGTGTLTDTSAASASLFTTGFGVRTGLAANTLHGKIDLARLSGNTWVCSGIVSASNMAINFYVAGSKTLSDVLTSVRLASAGSNTFDAGTAAISWRF